MRAALIFNPIKVDLDAIRPAVEREEKANGWAPTLWLETSENDPGQGAA
ncbi:MAG: diacylglycerol kinase, partial [Microbacteriaceae bacterium]|nr:diacylglycerol kinase [Microbacteriaceae bacterium]